MKKHELLKKAYDNYPKGTKFISSEGVEFISSGNFSFGKDILDYSYNDNNILNNPVGLVYYADLDKWADIIVEFKPKSILSGDISIKFNNKRELELILKHYESKGWVWFNGDAPLSKVEVAKIYDYNTNVEYKDKFGFNDSYARNVSFADFAKEVGIEVPKFIMTSEDGVDLYVGDIYYHLWHKSGKWEILSDRIRPVTVETSFYIGKASDKVFHSKENALKWIEEQNKPKSKTLPLYFGQEAIINFDKVEVRIMDGDKEVSTLSFGDINDLYDVIRSLNK